MLSLLIPSFTFLALPGCAAREGELPGTSLDSLHPEFVPAEARLVLHFDMQGLQCTQLWKALTAPGGPIDLEGEASELQEFKTQFGIDPLTDLLGVTVWGTSEDLEPEAAVLVTTANVDPALAALRLQPGYRSEIHDGIEVQFLSFEQDGEPEANGGTRVEIGVHSDAIAAYVHPLSGGHRAIVVAENSDRVLRAAHVVRGESPNLASTRGVAFQARPRPGSFFFGASLGGLPKTGGFQPASQIFGLAQGIQFDLGEAGGSFFVHAAISTADAELARKVRDSVAGVVAMGQLLIGSQPEVPQGVRDLLDAIRVTQSDTLVDLDFEYATAGLLDLLKSLEAFDEDESDESGEDE